MEEEPLHRLLGCTCSGANPGGSKYEETILGGIRSKSVDECSGGTRAYAALKKSSCLWLFGGICSRSSGWFVNHDFVT